MPIHPHDFLKTQYGYVCWLPLDDLGSTSTALSFSSYVIPGGTPPPPSSLPSPQFTSANTDVRKKGNANGVPTHCNRTLAATWGMLRDGNTVQMIDQSGTRWQLDYNGTLPQVTMKQEVGRLQLSGGQPVMVPAPGPYRSLRKVPKLMSGSSNVQVSSMLPGVGSDPKFVGPPTAQLPNAMAFAATPAADTDLIFTAPYDPIDDFLLPGAPPAKDTARVWTSDATPPSGPVPGFSSHLLISHDGFVAFPKGGDVAVDPSTIPQVSVDLHVCWWVGDGKWPNRVQGFMVPNVTSGGQISNWWSSAGGLSVGTSAQSSATVTGHDLRNHVRADAAEQDAQAMVLFIDPVANRQRIALFTPGARIMVLERGTSDTDIGGTPLERDSTTQKDLDYGQGGLALAVGDALGSGSNQIVNLYCGPVTFYCKKPTGTTAQDATSAIVRIEYHGAAAFSNAFVHEVEKHVLDGSSPMWPKVHGVCGMAVGEIVATHVGKELVVTSLDGHLLVYGLSSSGAIEALVNGQPFMAQVDGALGAHNSIVIADIDGATGNELYVAGSLGLWKWK